MLHCYSLWDNDMHFWYGRAIFLTLKTGYTVKPA